MSDDATTGTAGDGQQQTGQEPATSSTTGTADPWAGYQWDGNVDSLPEPIAKVIRDARADAGKARTGAKQQAADQARQELAQQIGKALGLVTDGDQAPDPAQLTEQLAARQAGERDALVRLAVYETADQHGAKPAALVDSRTFMDKTKGLDPTADNFAAQVAAAAKAAVDANPALKAAQVAAAAKAAVDANPALKAAQVAARSGGEFTGGPGGDAVTQEQFARMSVAQRQELYQRDPALYRKLAGR